MQDTAWITVLTLVETAEPHLQGTDHAAWMAQLDAAQDEIRAALQWAVTQPDKALALRLAGGLWRYWYTRGTLRDGQTWLEQALVASDEAPPAVRAKALDGAGVMAMELGQVAASRGYHTEALRLYEGVGDQPLIAGNHESLGLLAMYEHDYDLAITHLQQSLSIREALGDPNQLANTLLNLGTVAVRQGDYTAARAYLAQAAALQPQLTSSQLATNIRSAQAFHALQAQDYGPAEQHAQDALRLSISHDSPREILVSLENLAAIAVETGQAERAAQLYGAAETVYTATGIPVEKLTLPDRPGRLARAQAQLGDEPWQAAWAAGTQVSPAAFLAEGP
ncbi:MAG TPA: tetratricopeptide repeat protein [Herpetosiphonaceae bacterium]